MVPIGISTVKGKGDPTDRPEESVIGSVTKRQEREEDYGEKAETETVQHPFAEPLGQFNMHDDENDDTHQRHKEKNDPPDRLINHIQEHDIIVDGNEALPPCLSGFFIDLPERHDHEDDKEQHSHNKAEDRGLRYCR